LSHTSVNHIAYQNTLQTWFVPKLRERGLEATAVLQQDGAPANVALPVREYLEDRFSGRRIGRDLLEVQTQHVTIRSGAL
jgi:hypothetical protein